MKRTALAIILITVFVVSSVTLIIHNYISELEKHVGELKSQNSELQDQINELQEENRDLQEENNELQEYIETPKVMTDRPPDPDTVMTIETPKNITYTVSPVTLNFTVETNLALRYFYSLDGQKREPIDNITTISEELLTDWPILWIDGTRWYRKTLIGTCLLQHLSEGEHSLTVYQIYPLSPQAPQEGNVIHSANIQFSVNKTANISELPFSPSPTPAGESNSFPSSLVIASVVVVAVVLTGLGLLLYGIKRK